MTQVNMPEPVTYAHFTPEGLIRMWSREKTNLQSVTDYLEREPEALITTTQAEAYAEARVREALEEAAKICWEMQSAPEFGKDDKDRWLAIAESRIRSMIKDNQ